MKKNLIEYRRELTDSLDSGDKCTSTKTWHFHGTHRVMVVDYPNRIPQNIAVRIDAQYRSQPGQRDTILWLWVTLSLLHYQYRIQFGPVAQHHPME